ncbi:tetratricopeptide repeat protein [Nodularia chucula]|uniref:tetratricopeptide repeat protein n=1 Tax=Nodularia chucula TaxID=3093667 RepID=UPI0039C6400F
MSQSRNRWVVRIILALAVTAFVGISVIPIIGAINNPSPSNQNAASTNNNIASSDQVSRLQDEVRGYELVLQREPENQTALNGLLQARLQLLSFRQGDIQGVIPPLEKLAQLNPEQSEYGVLLAQAKQQMGDQEGAAQAYRSILDTKPGDLNALQGMVALLLDQERPAAAVSLLEETLANGSNQRNVDTVAVQVLLGTVHASQQRYPQATSVYDQAIKKDPQDFRPVLAKAMLFREQGKVEEAKPLFDSAVALAPAQYKDEITRAATLPTPGSEPTELSPETPAEDSGE